MLKAGIATLLLLVTFTSTAEAARRQHHNARQQVTYHCGSTYNGDIANYCSNNFLQGVRSIKVRMKRVSAYKKRQHVRHARHHKKVKSVQLALRHHFPQQKFNFNFNLDKVRQDIIQKTTRFAARLQGIVEPLASKAAEIQAVCGSKVISGVRHTYIAGTRIISLHATGQAVDMQGNPACIYRHLAGWQGGYSTDYSRVQHVHISWGGREHGTRFAHGGGWRTRYAARHRHSYGHRYASAQHRAYKVSRYHRYLRSRHANAG